MSIRRCGRLSPHRALAARSSARAVRRATARSGSRQSPARYAATSRACASTTGSAEPVDCISPTNDSEPSPGTKTCRYSSSRTGSATTSRSRKGVVAR